MIKVRSRTDVITNSSSESFVMKRLPGDTRTFEEIKEDLEAYHRSKMSEYPGDDEDGYSGDVQDLEIDCFDKVFEDYKSSKYFVNEKRRSEFTKQMYNIIHGYPDGEVESYIWVCLDKEFKATIKKLLKEFFVFEVDVIDYYTDESGRITRKATMEEIKARYAKDS